MCIVRQDLDRKAMERIEGSQDHLKRARFDPAQQPVPYASNARVNCKEADDQQLHRRKGDDVYRSLPNPVRKLRGTAIVSRSATLEMKQFGEEEC